MELKNIFGHHADCEVVQKSIVRQSQSGCPAQMGTMSRQSRPGWFWNQGVSSHSLPEWRRQHVFQGSSSFLVHTEGLPCTRVVFGCDKPLGMPTQTSLADSGVDKADTVSQIGQIRALSIEDKYQNTLDKHRFSRIREAPFSKVVPVFEQCPFAGGGDVNASLQGLLHFFPHPNWQFLVFGGVRTLARMVRALFS